MLILLQKAAAWGTEVSEELTLDQKKVREAMQRQEEQESAVGQQVNVFAFPT